MSLFRGLTVLLIVHLVSLLTRAAPALADEIRTVIGSFSTESNYAWTAVVSAPEGGRSLMVQGKADRHELSAVTIRFGDRTIHGYLKGNKAYVTSPDTNWKSVPEMDKGESPGQFMNRMVRNVVPPAKEMAELASLSASIRQEIDTFAGELSETAARGLLQDRRNPAKRNATLKNAAGSVKFWTKDGSVTKYEFTIRGKAELNGVETDMSRTTVVEIKDVGTTTVTLPDRAKEKLGIAKEKAP